MLSPVSKRRKTSTVTSIVAGVENSTESGRQPSPSTPSRASYQSPTKASLSRSHPTILASSPQRRGSEGRGKSMRQEVLLGKINNTNLASQRPLPPSQALKQHNDGSSAAAAAAAAAAATTSTSTATAVSSLPAPAESLAETVTRAFTHPPAASRPPRSPLRPRQPSTRNHNEAGKKSGQNIMIGPTSRTVGALSRSHENLDEQTPSAEPDLPPTPTQLGLSPKPGRPRGLTASSSPSSHGSRRSRRTIEHVEISSPLKSRGKIAAARTQELFSEQAGEESVEEATESGIGQAEVVSPTQREAENSRDGLALAEDTTVKHRIRADLKAQLARLQAETAQLESILNVGEEGGPLGEHLLSLLTTPNISCDPDFSSRDARPSFTAVKDPVALDVNPLAFLRAFAPGDLRLVTNTKFSSVRGRLYQAHTLNISAPPPWPPHVFNATLRVTCDVEAKRVTSITGASIRPRHGPGIKELRHWVEARLKNPLHKYDAGTLVWGLGMWWKQAVARAHFFRHVGITRVSKAPDAEAPYEANLPIRATDVQSLLPYLGKAFVELIPAEPYSNRASTNEARKYRQPRLLLKWDLELDWAGEVHTVIGVAGTKVSAQGQEGIKKVFADLMTRNGLDTAVRQVVTLCGGGVGAKGTKRKGSTSVDWVD